MQQTQSLTSSPGSTAAGWIPVSSSSSIFPPRCEQKPLVHPDLEAEMAEFDRSALGFFCPTAGVTLGHQVTPSCSM